LLVPFLFPPISLFLFIAVSHLGIQTLAPKVPFCSKLCLRYPAARCGELHFQYSQGWKAKFHLAKGKVQISLKGSRIHEK
jgi:hypothetical protein